MPLNTRLLALLIGASMITATPAFAQKANNGALSNRAVVAPANTSVAIIDRKPPTLAASANSSKEFWLKPDEFVFMLPNGRQLTVSDARKLLSPAEQGAELNMIEIQSLISKRATALQLTSTMLEKLNESAKAVAANIGRGPPAKPSTEQAPVVESEQATGANEAPEAIPEPEPDKEPQP